MVALVRKGRSMRSVARRFGVTLRTVQRWVERAGSRRLDRVDFSGARGGRRASWATDEQLEQQVIEVRQDLRQHSDLGEFGAAAIRRELLRRQPLPGNRPPPSVRTIGRILERRGALEGRRRWRFPAPPKGWYLPEVRQGRAELDSFDLVEGLVIQGGIQVEVLNGISLLGGLCVSRVEPAWTAKTTLQALLEHWREHGFPDYVQFDNDTLFQGNHRWPDSFGRVTRMCLQLGLKVVFAPPRETGFQAAIESYNGRWQQKVWRRFRHASLAGLRERSDRYVAACRARAAARIEAAPARHPVPDGWQPDFSKPLRGTVIYLRRTTEAGQVRLLGRDYGVDPAWCHRLVRCEVDLSAGRIRFYRLRRRQPTTQPLLLSIPYQPPTKPFQG